MLEGVAGLNMSMALLSTRLLCQITILSDSFISIDLGKIICYLAPFPNEREHLPRSTKSLE